jgi:hypothetical protein
MMNNFLGTVPQVGTIIKSTGHLVHSFSGAGISLGPEPQGDEGGCNETGFYSRKEKILLRERSYLRLKTG